MSNPENSASGISHTLEDTAKEDFSTERLSESKSGKVFAKINQLDQEMKWMAD